MVHGVSVLATICITKMTKENGFNIVLFFIEAPKIKRRI